MRDQHDDQVTISNVGEIRSQPGPALAAPAYGRGPSRRGRSLGRAGVAVSAVMAHFSPCLDLGDRVLRLSAAAVGVDLAVAAISPIALGTGSSPMHGADAARPGPAVMPQRSKVSAPLRSWSSTSGV